jgi:GNAT superfamily N-acetyltransferase
MALEIRSATEPKDFTRFVDLPFRLYQSDPFWVPPLKSDVRLLFDRAKNPFFEHAEVESFLAWRDGRVVGRIAAIDNRAHNEFHGDKVGFYGFFECEDDVEAAQALFDAAEAWLAARGMDTMRGPMNFSTNDDCGSLIDGFDTPPTIMMPHNKPYHAKLHAAGGFVKAKDLVAYWMEDAVPPERLVRGVELIKKRKNIVTRPMNMKNFDAEVDIIRDIYNSAWERNWGFIPMTAKELDHMAKQLKPVVDPELVVFAEVEGEPVAFALGLPDFNVALKHAGGSLLPFGLFAILWWQRRIHHARVLTLGIKPGHRASGIDALLYYEMFTRGRARGYMKGEFSWVLEDNTAMRRPLENMGARVYKTYRVYDRPVRAAVGTGGGATGAPGSLARPAGSTSPSNPAKAPEPTFAG